MGLVAPWHVGSSQTRAQTRVPCIGRQIVNHCATREAHWTVFWCHGFILPVLELHLNGLMQYVLFWVWLISLSIKFLRFVHVLFISSSFALLSGIPLCDVAQLIYPVPCWWTPGLFSYLQLWTFVYRCLLDVCFHVKPFAHGGLLDWMSILWHSMSVFRVW